MASTKTSKYPPAKPHEIAKLLESGIGSLARPEKKYEPVVKNKP